MLICVFPVVAMSDALRTSQTGAPTVVEIVGSAYDPSSGQLLYRELHLASKLDEKGRKFQQVDYQTPSGRLFAQKNSRICCLQKAIATTLSCSKSILTMVIW